MLANPRPSFLKLPDRATKPRRAGLTHVLDKGCTLLETQEVLSQAADFIDFWKFGWGTSYIDRSVCAKVVELRAAGVKSCTGGTLLEIAWMQGQEEAMFRFAGEAGFDCVEISDGAVDIPVMEKRKLISRARDLGFTVLAEVGSKDPNEIVAPDCWLEEAKGDISAGANWIVAEGRESGNVGLYKETGEVRRALLESLSRSSLASKIIYETPRRAQQSFMLGHLGSNANLGNIPVSDVLGLETLRLGLRADTLGVLADFNRKFDVRV